MAPLAMVARINVLLDTESPDADACLNFLREALHHKLSNYYIQISERAWERLCKANRIVVLVSPSEPADDAFDLDVQVKWFGARNKGQQWQCAVDEQIICEALYLDTMAMICEPDGPYQHVFLRSSSGCP